MSRACKRKAARWFWFAGRWQTWQSCSSEVCTTVGWYRSGPQWQVVSWCCCYRLLGFDPQLQP